MITRFYTRNIHVFAFNNSHRGVSIKFRRQHESKTWAVHQFTFFTRNGTAKDRRHRDRMFSARGGRYRLRPTLTLFEYAFWEETKGKGRERARINRTKGYIRVKACAPGKEVLDGPA